MTDAGLILPSCMTQARGTMWETHKGSAGVAPEVNLRECVTGMPLPSSDKAANSGFETQRRRHHKSKTGVSVAPQKGLMSSKKF